MKRGKKGGGKVSIFCKQNRAFLSRPPFTSFLLLLPLCLSFFDSDQGSVANIQFEAKAAGGERRGARTNGKELICLMNRNNRVR